MSVDDQPRSSTKDLRLAIIEHMQAEIAEVLSMQVDSDANLFELGLDSLLAAKIASGISSEFNVEVTMREIFDHPRISELAHHLAD